MPRPDAATTLYVVYSDTSGFGGHVIAVTRELSPELSQFMRQEMTSYSDRVWLVFQGGYLQDGWLSYEPTCVGVCRDRASAEACAMSENGDTIAEFALDWYYGIHPLPKVWDVDAPSPRAARYSRWE
ncbi:hypothetical protein CKALI_06035 [Corynebacterium kalinowskii]|uniref:Uncharacterized protein n=1 Tax=Corynebacterium kalinowskii TaxID=2675216 RepID=A0A6B8VTJ9_9CORY|nr:hypothetical protein [Corynebacterium kalinowskii]QGU02076.1 hypothetical protein CKALI_06035 [Corynebacterium kalinowskii]